MLFGSSEPDLWTASLAWSLVTCGLLLVFFGFFISLSSQVLGLAGSSGITSTAQLLKHIQGQCANSSPWAHFPTIFWITGASDSMLWASCIAGAASAILGLFYWSRLALAVCYVLALSLTTALPEFIIFPWDHLLLEAGALAVLLPNLGSGMLPDPWVALAFRVLLVRLLLGFGKTKFRSGFWAPENRDFIQSFLINIPLPSYLGCCASRLPSQAHRAALIMLFVVEVPVPLLVLVGILNHLGALLIIGQMVMIQLCGHFGHFAGLTMVLALGLLDSRPVLSGLLTLPDHPLTWIVRAILLAYLLAGVWVFFHCNSWTSSVWLHHGATWRNGRPIHLRILRALAPFHLVHGFGIFPAEALPQLRRVLSVQTSADGGSSWNQVGNWKYQTPSKPPAFMGLHMPRLDYVLFYIGAGIAIPTAFSFLNPFVLGAETLLDRLALRVAERSTAVLKLLDCDEQPPHAADALPTLARVVRSGVVLMPLDPEASLLNEPQWIPFPHDPPVVVVHPIQPTVARRAGTCYFPQKEALHWQLLPVWSEILGHKILQRDQLSDPINSCEQTYGDMEQFWQYAALLSDKGGDAPAVYATHNLEERKRFHAVACTLAFALLVQLQPLSASLCGFVWLEGNQSASSSSADVINGITLSEVEYRAALADLGPNLARTLDDRRECSLHGEFVTATRPVKSDCVPSVGFGLGTAHTGFATAPGGKRIVFWKELDVHH